MITGAEVEITTRPRGGMNSNAITTRGVEIAGVEEHGVTNKVEAAVTDGLISKEAEEHGRKKVGSDGKKKRKKMAGIIARPLSLTGNLHKPVG
jgi:hypothetical protein